MDTPDFPPFDFDSSSMASLDRSRFAEALPSIGAETSISVGAEGSAAREPGRVPLAFSLSRWSIMNRDGEESVDAACPPGVESETAGLRTTAAPGMGGLAETIDGPPRGMADTVAEPRRRAGEQPAGRPAYRLSRLVGRGGMGEVWEATQEALGRPVAVKRVRAEALAKAGASGPRREEAIRAFRQEAATTARLEHPNIVPVHDLGEDEDGAPLLAMKLVKGKPWDEALRVDWRELSARDFLAKHLPALAQVAQAAAFAHSKGIIHRDLKPSQVMTGEFGETLLMDWGLAVHIPEAASSASSEPAPGQADARQEDPPPIPLPTRESATSPAGTPALMAPEQTEESAAGVGIWTDVYLLGGVLYNLLTGTYPHVGANAVEAMARAREGAIQAPSVRAAGREVPAELESICLRALARKPADRYSSAPAFLEALNGYLTGASRLREAGELIARVEEELREAVEAGDVAYPELSDWLSRLGRARSLAPDHPELPPLLARALGLYARAALAADDLTLARVYADRLEESAPRDELLAEIAAAELRAALHARQRKQLIVGVGALFALLAAAMSLFAWETRSKNALLAREKAVAESARALAAENAAKAIDQADLASARAAEGQRLVAFMLEDLQDGLDLRLERDRRLRDQVAEKVMEHCAAIDLERASPEDQIDHASFLVRVAEQLDDFALYEDAERLNGEALSIRRRLLASTDPAVAEALAQRADLRFRRGDFAEAEALARQSLELLGDNPDGGRLRWAIEARAILGRVHQAMGRLEEAASMFRQALERAGDLPGGNEEPIAAMRSELAEVARRRGDFVEAERLGRMALEEWASAQGRENATYCSMLNNLALALRGQLRYAEAEQLTREVVDLTAAAVGEKHPDHAMNLNNLSILLDEMGRYDEAERLASEALRVTEAALGPNHPTMAIRLANMASSLQSRGELEEAEPLLRRALEIDRTTYGEESNEVAIDLNNLATLLSDQKRLPEAREALDRALAINEAVHGPRSSQVGRSLNGLGSLCLLEGDLAGAEPLLRRAIAIGAETSGPDHPDLFARYWTLGRVLRRLGQRMEAEEALKRSIAIGEGAWGPNAPQLALPLGSLASLLMDANQPAESLQASRRALRLQEASLGPNAAAASATLNDIGVALHMLGRYDEAEPALRRALEISRSDPRYDDAVLSTRLLNLAKTLLERQSAEEALRLLEESLAAAERAFGPRDPSYVSALGSYAVALAKSGRAADAERSARLALSIDEEAAAPPILIARDHFVLGTVLMERAAWDESEASLRRAADDFARMLGADHANAVRAKARLDEMLARKQAANDAPPPEEPRPPRDSLDGPAGD